MSRRVVTWLLMLIASAGCGGGDNESSATYRAAIIRDDSGVPHIEAEDWASLGYGDAWAFAEDNFCRLAEQLVTVRAKRSRFFGPERRIAIRANDADDSNLDSDFFYQRIIDAGVVERLLSLPPPLGPDERVKQLGRGWVAGYNDYLHSGELDDPSCVGQPWVEPISEIDLWRRIYQLVLLASGGRFISGAVAAQPPQAGAIAASTLRALGGGSVRRAFRDQADAKAGSSAFAIGAEGMRTGRSLLLSNSHLPWPGTERFWMHHLRIAGEYDVWGASIFGVPLINQGYNGDIAWAHTNDVAFRFAPVRLQLLPGNPTSYIVDGVAEAMESQTVSVQVLTPAGTIETRSHTFYISRYGLITNIPDAFYIWTGANAYALADSNADNLRAANTWLQLGQARNVGDVRAVLDSTLGTPWSFTLGADRNGDVIFSDAGSIPNIDQHKIETCIPAGPPTRIYRLSGVVTLDGSRSECALGARGGAVAPGVLAPADLPTLVRRDWVANSNNSHWIANPEAPLTGYSPIVGKEAAPLSIRARHTYLLLRDRLAGGDDLGAAGFDLETAQRLVLSNRSHGGELLRDRLVQICESSPTVTIPGGRVVDVSAACPVLASWDLTGDLDSRGSWLFTQWWRWTPSTPAGFWADDFDPANPLTTPNQLDLDSVVLREALGRAVANLEDYDVPLDVAVGQVQVTTRGDDRLPIHGCGTGCFNTIWASDGSDGEYGEVTFGSTVLFAVQIEDQGARGAIINPHGQATDETSPNYSAGVLRYAQKQWLPMRYTDEEIAAASGRTSKVVEGPQSFVGR